MKKTDFILYTSPDGQVKTEALFKDETIWLTQKTMGMIFGKHRSVINKHLKNIYESGELNEISTCANFAQVQNEGNRQVSRDLEFYNLDAIISVGYRVNSKQATKFRIWATGILREYIIKGFALDDERLKHPNDPKYYDELIERVRAIRTSEFNLYRKVRDLYSLSIDYDSKSETTKRFYAKMQNKLHWAIHGNTASELIYKRANSDKKSMGLTNWKNLEIQKADTLIAKNYLKEDELKKLELLVDSYLSFAEFQAMNKVQMTMKDWEKKLDAFLTISDREILKNAGKISKELAEEKAKTEFKKYRKIIAFEQNEKDLKELINKVKELK